ncbi:MAG: cytochrome c-type biogenesis protein CcmH [Proteobacteria bacterium]|nr:cytochrome c-type biogenesis protein CcmH [Pseudomonadota bacterium]
MSLVALFLAVAAPAALGDPALEARADALEMEIRCVQCQNEPIAQSTADIAVDMRGLVRERIAAGDSDDQIRAFFRQRYGDFVLFRPPWDARTWALWASPLLLLAAGLAATGALRRRRRSEDLAPEESER